MKAAWFLPIAALFLVSCGAAETDTPQTTKTETKTADPEARSIEQAADEAAKLVEAESLTEIKATKEKNNSSN